MKFRRRIPVNLIVGFLGTGKTTAVLHVLREKPAAEKWAVLVNEFGEIGIDEALLAGSGAHIRQVAGGCMCCVGNLPMRVALNNLIAKVQPDRLLIEATGLGHPQAVIDTLCAPPYDELLELRAVLCLVDPRKLREAKYRRHPLFADQLAVADVVVANKVDLCAPEDRIAFDRFVDAMQPAKAARGWVANGALRTQWLDEPRGTRRLHAPAASSPPLPDDEADAAGAGLPDDAPYLRREQARDGYRSCGWRFAESVRFDARALEEVLRSLDVVRMKGVLNTDAGAVAINAVDGAVQLQPAPRTATAALELIDDATADWDAIERRLFGAQLVQR